MTNATARPWKIIFEETGRKNMPLCVGTKDQSYTQAPITCYTNEDNAELIVKAVNAYEDLRAACEAVIGNLYDTPAGYKAFKLVQKALAKAEG